MTLKTWILSYESDSFVSEVSLDYDIIILLYNYILSYEYMYLKKKSLVRYGITNEIYFSERAHSLMQKLHFNIISLFSAFGGVGDRFTKALTCLWTFEICGLTISQSLLSMQSRHIFSTSEISLSALPQNLNIPIFNHCFFSSKKV